MPEDLETHHGVLAIAARCVGHRGTLSLPTRHGAFSDCLQRLRKFHFELSVPKSYGARVGVLSAME